ncbi:RNase adapter RapZ [Pleionea sp. CnH1-48]|uniref:RNase adapter RapZ n=1 Tax=Pleionea sp. CnH1-48 TaxID=2954494 RepID=UPI00209849CB|nr:RNase adapter RapZ [Pleionea sp. CnH1-48]MCO7224036.1 RNase adapter RapZ [Pleionea sp. CnH1-48]
MKRIILSGRSGSGKTVALRALEDQGFYCVDNIPLSLVPSLVETFEDQPQDIALGIDARSFSNELDQFSNILEQLNENDEPFQVYFIDADDRSLLQRFSETRRRHPLTQNGLSLKEAIAKERELLEPIALCADLLVDTTSMTPYALRDFIRERALSKRESSMDIMFESFGFKNGIPTEADYVFDVRCLPNPYWDPDLRSYNGTQGPIIEYLESQPMVNEFFWQLKVFLHTWIPRFEQNNRSYLTIAIGCTGGHHRSVYMAERLAKTFSNERQTIQIRHRDLKDD